VAIFCLAYKEESNVISELTWRCRWSGLCRQVTSCEPFAWHSAVDLSDYEASHTNSQIVTSTTSNSHMQLVTVK